MPESHLEGAWSQAADEASLIRRCQDGEAAAFDPLVARYQRQVFAVAWRWLGDYAEANDVAQDAFVRAYRAIGAFRGESKFSTWLVAIVINLCRNRRRWWMRRRQWTMVSLDEPIATDEGTVAADVADPAPTPQAEAERAELRARLAAALELLDDHSRAIVVLRDVQGLSYDEIARLLRCRIGTVKSRLNRARLRLRAILNGVLER